MQVGIIRGRSGGFSLVEFMVAITVSLIVLAALVSIFASNTRARREVERANQQIENGRYAMQLLADDLQLAGYWGEFDMDSADRPTPGNMPNPCTTDADSLRFHMPLHIQGINGGAAPACVPDLRAGTDIVIVRRARACLAGSSPNCVMEAGAPYFQASLCSRSDLPIPELASPNSNAWFRLDYVIARFNRTQRDCATRAALRQYLKHIYFVANNDAPGDGIPTLKRAELHANAFTIVPLVNGIENLQVEYGVDTSVDGGPDTYTANPTTLAATGSNCPAVMADCVQNWRNVVSVKLHVLARGLGRSSNTVDSKVYTMGLNEDGSNNVVGPLNDAFPRHLFQSVVRLNNPSNRRK